MVETKKTGGIVAAILAAAFMLSACEQTVRGAGQDIQDAGQAIEQSVE